MTRASHAAGAIVIVLLLGIAAARAAGPPQPLRGQDLAQQARDTETCDKLAIGKSGYDPAHRSGGVVKEATSGAAAGAAGGIVSGGITGGAAAGAVAGAARGHANSNKQAIYDRERSACLIGRGYKLGG